VRLASRGRREVEGRTEAIADAAERAALRRRGAAIAAKAALVAAALTALAWVLPR
jgi:hypothetical protein